MKRSLAFLAAVLFAAVGFVGCGDNDTTGPIDVNPTLTLSTGDKFTYNYYDRDGSNVRDESTKRKVVWTVVNVDKSVEGRSDAVEVQEDRYGEDGTTIEKTNTIYLAANSQGQVYQYSVLKVILNQFSSSSLDLSPVLDQLPNVWSQISDVKSPGTLSWNSLVDIVQSVDNVEIINAETLNIKVEMSGTAEHEGRKSTTVEAGTYEKAFVTDHAFDVTISANEDKTIANVIPVQSGDVLIKAIDGDAMELHYAVDVDGGILSMSMDSKEVTIEPLGPAIGKYPIQGFEMELTAVERASVQ